ncbi:hypothetical protein TUBRATIS_18660 [Tubulinosema ratisbonensis]|uniref:Uncharacterized protein n=1 Tax=Tubulinosema ratisbonensis TaxID=291195 RepID=A0A437AKF7_9MICR|nr:hypothetical protein TUBRATIS_19760 [Tubulinosema ratisbonensis]RVD91675.1 hypothetical protein TUBRATIS_18660 [Tubulinosema ratisbonensis]
MNIKEKIEKLKSSKKFTKPSLSKYGTGTFLSIDSPKSLTQEIEELYHLFDKELNIQNIPNQPIKLSSKKELENELSLLNLIIKIIKLILILEEENKKESINEYKKLCKNIVELTKYDTFNKVFVNVWFHSLYLESNLVYGILENKRSVDDKCLVYFLREYKHFGEVVQKNKGVKLVRLDELENELIKEK